jgi:probable rRNA maturation factor
MQIIFVNKGLPQNMTVLIRSIGRKKMQRIQDRVVDFLRSKKIRNKSKLDAKELTVVWLSALEMRKINFKFRKKNKATDVLSFLSRESDSLGELLLCPEVLQSQAKQFRHSFEVETVTMIIHGLLHLLGYDHERSAQEHRLMFRLQEQTLDHLDLKA